ncbi:hypothetical protein [Dyadobacter sp. 676]|uniref:Uncharacterized protein n=1 Tax=Dyadobacter sp. 676 TaxID=3088362 RepID=A0AAU8FPV5_9BACT
MKPQVAQAKASLTLRAVLRQLRIEFARSAASMQEGYREDFIRVNSGLSFSEGRLPRHGRPLQKLFSENSVTFPKAVSLKVNQNFNTVKNSKMITCLVVALPALVCDVTAQKKNKPDRPRGGVGSGCSKPDRH